MREKAPLDDLMLAMDVVDTLRRRQRLVKRELDTPAREEDLKARLRKIYQAQGIEVPDRVLAEGVAALSEDRFRYRPPADRLAVRLARIYVSRGRWGKWLLAALAVGILIWTLVYVFVIAPNAALPERLNQAYAETIALASTDRARQRVEQLHATATAALQADDTEATHEALSALDATSNLLRQEYRLRIVNQPGKRTGVWRIPDVNTQARNYYLIVEAIDPSGRQLRVPITSEETGETTAVTTWGLRVDERTFERIARDKQDDGIIQQDRFGQKPRGALEPVYELPTSGGGITQW
jgi:hypothetical protein